MLFISRAPAKRQQAKFIHHPRTQHSGRMKPTPSTCLACVVLSFTPASSFLSGPAASASPRLPWATNGVSSSSPSHPIRHATAGAAGSQARGLALRMVAAPEISTTKAPGTAGLDWENLGFEYRDGEHMIQAEAGTAVVAWFRAWLRARAGSQRSPLLLSWDGVMLWRESVYNSSHVRSSSQSSHVYLVRLCLVFLQIPQSTAT